VFWPILGNCQHSVLTDNARSTSNRQFCRSHRMRDNARHSPAVRPHRCLVAVSLLTFLGASSLGIESALATTVAHFRVDHGQPLNDLRATPGAVFAVTAATICRPGYASSVRDVPASEKNRDYAEYAIAVHATGQYEVDHLISLELGGDNAITNLWPELNDHPHGYLNSKDVLENRLHDLVCTHKIGLAAAQHLIATNWVTEYHRVIGAWPKAAATPKPTTTTAPAPLTVASTTSTTRPSNPTSSTSPTTTTTVTVGPTTTSIPTQTGTVAITALGGAVAPGSTESLSAHSSKANDSCDLSVMLPSGRESTASGLGTMSADASGNATWTWDIGPTTGSGTATALVTCGAGRASQDFTVT
jgi:hypothetical protein